MCVEKRGNGEERIRKIKVEKSGCRDKANRLDTDAGLTPMSSLRVVSEII